MNKFLKLLPAVVLFTTLPLFATPTHYNQMIAKSLEQGYSKAKRELSQYLVADGGNAHASDIIDTPPTTSSRRQPRNNTTNRQTDFYPNFTNEQGSYIRPEIQYY